VLVAVIMKSKLIALDIAKEWFTEVIGKMRIL